MSHGGWGVARLKQVNLCGHPAKPHYAKGLCRQCYRVQPHFLAMRQRYYQANKPLFIEHSKRARAERRRQVKVYGVSQLEMQAMLDAQGNRCAICGDPPKRKALALDHDHATGRIRAFLCHACNGALGLFRDDQKRLRLAIAYLRSHRRHHSLSPAPATSGTP